MIKHNNFYRVVVVVRSDKSGDEMTIVDDYYTPSAVGGHDALLKQMNWTLSELNKSKSVQDAGGKFVGSVMTCCFNNGKGRSSKAISNIQPYLVKEPKNPDKASLAFDMVFQESLNNGLEWLFKQQPPF